MVVITDEGIAIASATPNTTPSADSQDSAEHRDHGGLGEHHLASLAAAHAHGAEQADLPRPLQHGEGKGVGDAEQRDQEGQPEQAVHGDQHAVELRLLIGLVAGAVVELHLGMVDQHRIDGRPADRRVDAIGQPGEGEQVEVAGRVSPP